MKSIPIIQLGIGNVGREVIRNVLECSDCGGNRIFRYIGIANSKSILFQPEGIPEQFLEEVISAKNSTSTIHQPGSGKHSGDLSPLLQEIERLDLRDFAIIDASDSEGTTPFLLGCAEKGAALVLANKKPLVREIATFRSLKRVPLGFRATIGAGLPIIPAIEKLISEGKKIHKMEGCFSGSLGILCSSLEEGKGFSVIVNELKDLGYTEPDPREDLSGKDMARKILILSRVSGYHLEFDDIITESLFPEDMASLSADTFLSDLRIMDDEYRERFIRASKQNCTLRFVATLEDGMCRVGLKEVPGDSLFGNLKGPEKLAVIHTNRDEDDPIVIRGAGAGAKSAAKDVFDDLMELTRIIYE